MDIDNDLRLKVDFFNEEQPFSVPWDSRERYSTLIVSFGLTRGITGRVGKSGFILDDPNEKTGDWLGAMGYMTILDQIGTIVSCKADTSYRNSIFKALKTFTQLSDLESHALIGLRNALFHDFCLINIGRGKYGNQQTHRFVVTNDNSQLVKLPSIPWDKNLINKNMDESSATRINLFAFGNIVEQMLIDLRTKLGNGVLPLNFEVRELINRYSFVFLPENSS